MKKRIHNPTEASGFRTKLRSRLTPAEAFLWKYLKARKLKGRRFQRQHGIGPYTVDFYCAAEKLIVELDGEAHNNPDAMDYDERRTKYLNHLGFTVIRFENHWVFDALPSILGEIVDHYKN